MPPSVSYVALSICAVGLFSDAGGGTHVERHVTMTKGPFYFPLVLAIFSSTVKKNYNGAMSNLKTKMEGGA